MHYSRGFAVALGATGLIMSGLVAGCNPLGVVGIGQDVTGDWSVTVDDVPQVAGPSIPDRFDMTIAEVGGKLTGSSGVLRVEGTRSFGAVTFTLLIPEAGTTRRVDYDGHLSWDGKTISGVAAKRTGADFVAIRKK